MLQLSGKALAIGYSLGHDLDLTPYAHISMGAKNQCVASILLVNTLPWMVLEKYSGLEPTRPHSTPLKSFMIFQLSNCCEIPKASNRE